MIDYYDAKIVIFFIQQRKTLIKYAPFVHFHRNTLRKVEVLLLVKLDFASIYNLNITSVTRFYECWINKNTPINFQRGILSHINTTSSIKCKISLNGECDTWIEFNVSSEEPVASIASNKLTVCHVMVYYEYRIVIIICQESISIHRTF